MEEVSFPNTSCVLGKTEQCIIDLKKNHAGSVVLSLKISLHVMEIVTCKGQLFYNELRRKYISFFTINLEGSISALNKTGLEMIKINSNHVVPKTE